MKKLVLIVAVLAMAHLGAATLLAGGGAPASTKRAINPPGTVQNLPFSNGIMVGDTLYVAGQEGLDNGKLRAGGIGPETQAALESIKKIVEAAGLQMSDVVSVTVFVADIKEFQDMNKVYKTFFADPRPARATVQVAGLVNGARVEISAIAVKTH